MVSILENYKLIVWDFDGTIVKLNVDWNKVKEEISKRYGGSFKEEPPLSINEMIYEIRKSTPIEEVFHIIEKYESASGYEPNWKVIKIIKKLKKAGKKQAILSDNMSNTVKRILTEASIHDCFSLIICKDSVSKFKPDTEGIKRILEYYNIDKSETVMIGDSWKDRELCDRIGIKFINVLELTNHG